MKSTQIGLARKWGIGFRLILWCWFAQLLMSVPVLLLVLIFNLGVPSIVVDIIIGAYVIICIPLIAYWFGRDFGVRYYKTPQQKDGG